MRNTGLLRLRLADGSQPPALQKGDCVMIGRPQDTSPESLTDQERDLRRRWGSTLATEGSAEADRALLERKFEDEKQTKVQALLKKLGAKNLLEARDGQLGFSNDNTNIKPELRELFQVLASQPPPPARPGILKSLFGK